MSTIQKQVTDKFLAKLAENKEVDAAQIELLRTLLTNGKKPKADDFVRIFSRPAGGEVQ